MLASMEAILVAQCYTLYIRISMQGSVILLFYRRILFSDSMHVLSSSEGMGLLGSFF